MAHQNKERPFLNATASSDTAHYLIQKACFGFLAVTTTVMVYGAFKEVVGGLLPGWMHVGGLAVTSVILFLIIDYKLDDDLMSQWRTRDQIRDATVPIKNARAARAYLRRRSFMLAVRFILTLTSSIWAGAEIANISTTPPDYAGYTDKIETSQGRSAEREAAAMAALSAAESAESEKVAEATREGDRLIARAISSGNVHQKSMYRTNPGFFYPPPRGQYYQSNKAYGQRIAAAAKQKEVLISQAKQPATDARQALAQIRGHISTDSTSTMITSLATAEVAAHASTVDRRATFVRGLDFVAALLGLLMLRIRYLRKKAAGWEVPAERRNLASMMAQFRDRSWDRILANIEETLNLDIDGDGHIGSPPTDLGAAAGARKGKRAMGGATYRAHGTAAEAAPLHPTDDRDGFFFRRRGATPPAPPKTVATSSYTVATDDFVATNPPTKPDGEGRDALPPSEAEELLGAWKSKMSTLKALNHRQATETVVARQDELQSQMDAITDKLSAMGWMIDKKPGRTGRYYLSTF